MPFASSSGLVNFVIAVMPKTPTLIRLPVTTSPTVRQTTEFAKLELVQTLADPTGKYSRSLYETVRSYIF